MWIENNTVNDGNKICLFLIDLALAATLTFNSISTNLILNDTNLIRIGYQFVLKRIVQPINKVYYFVFTV